MKKKLIYALTIIIICAGLFTVCMISKSSKSREESFIILENSYSRESYLNIKGLDVTEISCEKVRIPETFEGIYEEYSKVQDKQHLPLSDFKGQEVQRYLYTINNYTGDSKAYAELLIYDNKKLIAAAIIENKPDGSISALN